MARVIRDKMSLYNEGFKLETEKMLLSLKLRTKKDDRELSRKLLKIESRLVTIDKSLRLRRV